jgi:hypothetical protein
MVSVSRKIILKIRAPLDCNSLCPYEHLEDEITLKEVMELNGTEFSIKLEEGEK